MNSASQEEIMANSAQRGAGDSNTEIIEEFRANQGRVGVPWAGITLILIHHIGARSGIERVTPLAFNPQPDGRFAIAAANGGSPTHPDWYYNLKAHPCITVEVGTDTFTVVAEELDGSARAELLKQTDRSNPLFRNNRTRVIAAGRPLLAAAQHAGEVRDDLTLEQILDMIVAIAPIHGGTGYTGPILQSSGTTPRPDGAHPDRPRPEACAEHPVLHTSVSRPRQSHALTERRFAFALGSRCVTDEYRSDRRQRELCPAARRPAADGHSLGQPPIRLPLRPSRE